MNRPPAALVLTATVTPPTAMPGTMRNSAQLRRHEYEDAFRFYLRTDDDLIDHIVLLENSDADLEPFRKIASASGTRKSISLINCSTDYPAEMGKGYGEFLMIDRDLSSLDVTDPHKKYWKITSRLQVQNIAELIRTSPADYDFYCDMRNAPFIGDRLGGNQWMELHLFSFTVSDYVHSCMESTTWTSYSKRRSFLSS